MANEERLTQSEAENIIRSELKSIRARIDAINAGGAFQSSDVGIRGRIVKLSRTMDAWPTVLKSGDISALTDLKNNWKRIERKMTEGDQESAQPRQPSQPEKPKQPQQSPAQPRRVEEQPPRQPARPEPARTQPPRPPEKPPGPPPKDLSEDDFDKDPAKKQFQQFKNSLNAAFEDLEMTVRFMQASSGDRVTKDTYAALANETIKPQMTALRNLNKIDAAQRQKLIDEIQRKTGELRQRLEAAGVIEQSSPTRSNLDLDERRRQAKERLRAQKKDTEPQKNLDDLTEFFKWRQKEDLHPAEFRELDQLVEKLRSDSEDQVTADRGGNVIRVKRTDPDSSSFFDPTATYRNGRSAIDWLQSRMDATKAYTKSWEKNTDPNIVARVELVKERYLEPAEALMARLRLLEQRKKDHDYNIEENARRDKVRAELRRGVTNKDDLQALKNLEDVVKALNEAKGKDTKEYIRLLREYQRMRSAMSHLFAEMRPKLQTETKKYVDEMLNQYPEDIASLKFEKYKADIATLQDLIKRILRINDFTKVDPEAPVGADGKPIPVTITNLQALQGELSGLVAKLDSEGAMDEVEGDDAQGTQALRLRRRIAEAKQKVEDLIKSEEKKDPKLMTTVELAKALLKQRKDPFYWKELKSAMTDKWFDDLVNEFMERVVGEPESEAPPAGRETAEAKKLRLEAKERRLYAKVLVQLSTLDNELSYEPGKASGDRSKLFGEMDKRLFTRSDLIAATTGHEKYGKDIQAILNYVVKKAALHKWEPGFDPNFNYDELCSSRGRNILSEEISRRFPNVPDEARKFAELLFNSMDMMTISLTQLEKHTKTRGHNGGLKFKDVGLLIDPEKLVQRAQRYGGNDEDWSLWWLVYLPRLRLSPTEKYEPHKYARHIGRDEAGWKKLAEVQELLLQHQASLYPIDGFTGKHGIRFSGFCESLFPNTLDMVTLAPGERLSEGKDLKSFDLYQLAESGWEKMLEFCFKGFKFPLKKDDILSHAGEENGGMLHQFLKAAGKAKMFPGEHLTKALEPMLLHLCIRLLASLAGNKDAKTAVRNELIEALEESAAGGLSDYKHQMHGVISYLKAHPEILDKPVDVRGEQREKYLREYWRIRKKKQAPPGFNVGHALGRQFDHTEKANADEFFNTLNGKAAFPWPRPLTRDGTMNEKH
jgi:hypothetical protein